MTDRLHIERPIRRNPAKWDGAMLRTVDWTECRRYSEFVGNFEHALSRGVTCLYIVLREVSACELSSGYWPVSYWFRAKILFMTRLSKALRSAARHLPSPAGASSKAQSSVVQWALSSKRPNDLEIAISLGGRLCFISPLLGALRLGGWSRFFAALRDCGRAVISCLFRPKILTNRECLDV
jgi:hypothetical protein